MALSGSNATKGWARFYRVGCGGQMAVEMSVEDARAKAAMILSSWPFGGEVIEERRERRFYLFIIKNQP